MSTGTKSTLSLPWDIPVVCQEGFVLAHIQGTWIHEQGICLWKWSFLCTAAVQGANSAERSWQNLTSDRCLGQIGLMGDPRAAGELARSCCLLLSPLHQSCSLGSFSRYLKCSPAGHAQHFRVGMVVISSTEPLGYLSRRQISGPAGLSGPLTSIPSMFAGTPGKLLLICKAELEPKPLCAPCNSPLLPQTGEKGCKLQTAWLPKLGWFLPCILSKEVGRKTENICAVGQVGAKQPCNNVCD